MTIICATDFSDAAAAGCAVAAALAEQHREPLVLVHAILPVAAPPKFHAVEHLQDQRAAAEEALRDQARAIRGVEVTAHVGVGSPDEVVLEQAEAAGARLIVTGSVGQRGAKSLLGSTAERIVATSRIPVLVVRGPFPAAEWLRERRPLRVAVAADLGSGTDAAVEWTAHLTDHGPCEFVIAHVSWPPEAYERLAIEPPMHLDRTHPLVEEVVGRELAGAASRLRGEGETKTIVESNVGSSAAAIAQIAAREHADLLVVGKRGPEHRHWWDQSISRAVVRHAPMSVVCVPEQADENALPDAPIRRVVAATDFSRLGNTAVAYALTLGAAGAEVLLVHVAGDDVDAEERARRGALLEKLAVNAGAEILTGDDAARQITAAAERFGADVICVGSRGRSGLARALLGSVSQGVLLRARRPVLIIQGS